MTTLQVFTVFDNAVGAYMAPFTMKTKGLAIRAFIEAAKDPQHNFSRHGADFILFHVGSYDEETAQFTQDKPPQSLGSALELSGFDSGPEATVPEPNGNDTEPTTMIFKSEKDHV